MAHTLFCVVPIIFELSLSILSSNVRHADFEIFGVISACDYHFFSLESTIRL